MNKVQAITQYIKLKRLLFSQMIFTTIAFILMVVLSYFFVSNIVNSEISRYTESVFSYAQAQFEYDMTESENSLGSFGRSIRSMIVNGTDMEMLTYFTYDMAEFFHTSRVNVEGAEEMVEDLFSYIEGLPGDSEVLSGFGWKFPEGADPAVRPWHQGAVAANGAVAVSTPYKSLRSEELVVTFSQALFDDAGERIAIVGLNMQISEMGNNIVNIALASGGYGMLIDPNLTIIAHANPDFIGMNIYDPELPFMVFLDDIAAGIDIEGESFVNWMGEETIIYLRQLPNGWYVGLLTPYGPYYQSINDMMLILSILGLILTTALIFILIQIDRAKDRASEESRQKSAFLANMSHEIRTPLNAVIGLSELILETDEWNEENKYKLEQVNNAGRTLLNTVNDILDISKIESGKFELTPVTYDTPSVLNDASTQSILHMGEKPIEFVMNISENLPAKLFGDELRIKQILNNLLSNALKYTREGTVELEVDCVREGDLVWLIFKVSDTGIGIKQENMALLFNDYAQMDLPANRKIVGTGLGLSIAKRLVELMDGQITAESAYGKGSVFTVRLLQKHVTDDLIGHDVVESLKSFHYSEDKRRSFSSSKRLSLPYARVLIVDDVVTNLDVAKGLMKPYQMEVDCVTSGWEAVEAVYNDNIRYNAIFMDHMMPGIDGIEATRLIREIGTEYARNVPIIALTANAIVGNEDIFLNKGFQAFVSKPIEISRLDTVIREWVRDKEKEKLYVRHGDNESEAEHENTFDLLSFKDDIYGLNIEKGLRRFSSDVDAYISVLRSYARNTAPLLDSVLEVSAVRERLKDYETIVHGIKGSSSAICADKVADLASALEDAAVAGDFDFVTANNAAFLETTKKLIADIEKLLEKIEVYCSKPKKEKPDIETLRRLREACENYEMSSVDEALAELEAYAYETDGELVSWLRKNAEQTNFDEIAEKLSALGL